MPRALKAFARSSLGFLLLSVVAVVALLAFVLAPGLLLYLFVGRGARTPYQLFATALVVTCFVGILWLRLRRASSPLDRTRFYAIFGAMLALPLVESVQPAVSGSTVALARIVAMGVLLLAYAAGYLVERRRARKRP